ncbi:MAG: TraR/DksA C4-type zinc finger protein [Phycisphaerales bacterium]|jgi:RNA polymerase-binding protein DksA
MPEKKKTTKKKTKKTTAKVAKKTKSRKTARKSRLKPSDIEEFKFLLLRKRAEILGDVSCMTNETLKRERSDLSNVPFHMADAGSDNYELENTLGLMDEEVRLLAQIDAALGRIEDGTYGICVGSGKPIPKARLEAIPWARYCVEYAELVEKGLVKPESENEFGEPDSEPDEESDEDEDQDEEDELEEAMALLDEEEEEEEEEKNGFQEHP